MPNGNGHHQVLTLPHWRYPAKLPGLTGLYLNSVFRNLATGLIGIFIPVFVYKIAGGWPGLFSFFLTRETVLILTTVPIATLIKKLGPDWLIALGALALFFCLIFLIQSQTNPIFLKWAAIFLGITIPLHWLPYHLAFSWESSRHFLSRQVANQKIISKLATAAAPLIGGILATIFGFSGLYLAAGAILLLSIIPIFIDQYNRRGEAVSLSEIKQVIVNPKLQPIWWGFFGTGLETAIYSIFLPIFLYQALDSLEQIGLISTVSLVISLITLSYLGKKTQKAEKRVFRFGVVASLPFWLILNFLSSFSLLAIFNSLYQITTQAVWIPVDTLVYRWGRKKEKSFFIIRNIAIRLGIMAALGAATLFRSLNWDWTAIFLLATLGLMIVTNFSHGLKKTKRTFR